MILRKTLLATTSAFIALAYDNEPGWKMDGDKLATDTNGDPIYIDSSGREVSIKHDTIASRNGEAKTQRERADKAEAALKAYTGPDGKPIDPTAAIKAIDTVSKLDAKKLIDAGEVDTLRDQMRQEFAQQLSEKDNALAETNNKLNNLRIDNMFKGNDFIAERVAIPRDMIEASLRGNFKIGEDGKIEAYDQSGNRLMSKKSPGDFAEPNEAIELLIERHPQKDMILKAPDANGSGSQGGGGINGRGRTLKRAEFDAMSPEQKAVAGQAAAKGELTIAD